MPVLYWVVATSSLAPSGVKVLILTTFHLDEYVVAALRAGASGFLLKDVPAAQLVEAIRTVAAGDAVVAPAVTRRLLDRFAHRLPDQEARVLDRVTQRETAALPQGAPGLANLENAAAPAVTGATC